MMLLDQTRSGISFIHTSMPCVPQKKYRSLLGDTHSCIKFPSFYVCQTFCQLLGLQQLSLGSTGPSPPKYEQKSWDRPQWHWLSCMHGWAANWVEKDREPNIPPAPAELSTSSPLTREITHELTTPMHASLLPIVISPALLLSSSLSFVLTLSGGELRDTHFCQKTTTLQNTETSQKNEANACGQTKIDDVALSPSQGEATSTQTHPMAYTIAQRHTGIGTTTLSRPSFPCWVGRDEAVLLKKPIRPRNKVHTSTNSLFL